MKRKVHSLLDMHSYILVFNYRESPCELLPLPPNLRALPSHTFPSPQALRYQPAESAFRSHVRVPDIFLLS